MLIERGVGMLRRIWSAGGRDPKGWGAMRALVGAGLLIALVGCGTPYQQNGFMGGYDDYRAGAGGGVMLVFEGNGYTSEAAVARMWHRRAAQVCGGPEQYVVLDSEKGASVYEGASTSTTNVTYSGNQAYATTTTQPGMKWTKHRLEGVIRCVNGGNYDPNRAEGAPLPVQKASPPPAARTPESSATVTVTNPPPATPPPPQGSAAPLGF
jgi:hypothetical protein